MKNITQFFLMTTMTLLSSAPASYAEDTPLYKVERGPIQEVNGSVSYYLSSPYIKGESRVQVLRPKEKTNRILYLLPVTPWPGFEDKWARLGSGMTQVLKHDYHNQFGYTIIVPDFPQHMPWFVDHDSDPKRQHESYMMNVLIPFVDTLLKIKEPQRDLAGFSKAGYGSLSLLIRHPETFHAATAWDPGGILKPYEPQVINGLSNASGSKTRFGHYQINTSLKKTAQHFQGTKRIAISGHSNAAFLGRLHGLRDCLDAEGVTYLYDESIQVPHRWYTGWMQQALESLQLMQD
jgi:hypothetical protein